MVYFGMQALLYRYEFYQPLSGGSIIRPTLLLKLIILCIPPATASESAPLKELAAPCLACHSLEPDGDTHVGPSLAGIAGRLLGADDKYTYSEAFTQKALEGVIWDRASLDQFLKDPQDWVEGTAMSYPGVADTEHRAMLLDWLMSDPSGTGADLADANFNRDPSVRKVLETPADIEYGNYLAGECLTCHQAWDNSGRVPPIQNLTQDYFIHALLEYQNGARSNRVMQTVAGSLGVEEIAALSAVFSRNSSQR